MIDKYKFIWLRLMGIAFYIEVLAGQERGW